MNTRLLNSQPWRFKIGNLVYVRSWPAEETGKVTAQLVDMHFPHYLIVDESGVEWQIAQVELSRRPIPQE